MAYFQTKSYHLLSPIRNEWQIPGGHARLSTTLAELQVGWEIFLQFAQTVGALSAAALER